MINNTPSKVQLKRHGVENTAPEETSGPDNETSFKSFVKNLDIEVLSLTEEEIKSVSYTHLTLPTICSV